MAPQNNSNNSSSNTCNSNNSRSNTGNSRRNDDNNTSSRSSINSNNSGSVPGTSVDVARALQYLYTPTTAAVRQPVARHAAQHRRSTKCHADEKTSYICTRKEGKHIKPASDTYAIPRNRCHDNNTKRTPNEASRRSAEGKLKELQRKAKANPTEKPRAETKESLRKVKRGSIERSRATGKAN